MGASRRQRVSMNAPMPAEASVACGLAAFFVVGAIALPGVNTPGKTRDTRTKCTSHGYTVREWQPRCRRLTSLDRWLCVPAFRRVCLCHCAPPKVGGALASLKDDWQLIGANCRMWCPMSHI